MDPAAAQLPDDPAVDRPDGQLPGLGTLARARHVLQQPGDLGAGEVGIDNQARALAYETFVSAVLECLALRSRSPALPDDGAVNRLTALAVPEDHRLALIGDPEPGDVGRGQVAGFQRRVHRDLDRAPDLRRVVLHPSRLRIVLFDLPVRPAHYLTVPVHGEHRRPGRALIDGEDHCHNALSSSDPREYTASPRAPGSSPAAQRGTPRCLPCCRTGWSIRRRVRSSSHAPPA